jgi:hypothetical protein
MGRAYLGEGGLGYGRASESLDTDDLHATRLW